MKETARLRFFSQNAALFPARFLLDILSLIVRWKAPQLLVCPVIFHVGASTYFGGNPLKQDLGSEFLITCDCMPLVLDTYIVYLVRMLWRLVGLFRSRRWNRTTATVLGSHVESPYSRVSVDYEYVADGQKLAATFVKPFIFDSSAKTYADQFARGKEFMIRIKPGKPETSVADRSVENWWNYQMARNRVILYAAASAAAIASLPLSFFGLRWLLIRYHEWRIGRPLIWIVEEEMDAALLALIVAIVVFFVIVSVLKRTNLRRA